MPKKGPTEPLVVGIPLMCMHECDGLRVLYQVARGYDFSYQLNICPGTLELDVKVSEPSLVPSKSALLLQGRYRGVRANPLANLAYCLPEIELQSRCQAAQAHLAEDFERIFGILPLFKVRWISRLVKRRLVKWWR